MTETTTDIITITDGLKRVINDLHSREKITSRGRIDLFILFEKGVHVSQVRDQLFDFTSRGDITGRARIEILDQLGL